MTPYRLNSEPSAWLRGACARARRLNDPVVRAMHTKHGPVSIVLVNPHSGDRECDRCGLIVPVGGDFYPFFVKHAGVLFVVGLCAEHVKAEVAT